MPVTLLCDETQVTTESDLPGYLAAEMPAQGGGQRGNCLSPPIAIQTNMLPRGFSALLATATLWAGTLAVPGLPVAACTQAWAQPQGAQSHGAAANATANPVAAASQLPDAPDLALPPQDSSAVAPPEAQSDQGQQTKRILDILPNFRSVSVNAHLPPQSPKEELIDVGHDSFDYTSFIFIGILAGVAQLQGSAPEFRSGAPAYARYYWHSFADQTDENLWVGFLLPVALHQDARFYTLGSGTAKRGKGHNGVAKRVAYAFTRILITRTDSGGNCFNYSEVVGAGASASISNLYYPASSRGWNKTGQRWVLNVGIDGGTFIFKEFWPDLNHALFYAK